jgi:hypothetical protein
VSFTDDTSSRTPPEVSASGHHGASSDGDTSADADPAENDLANRLELVLGRRAPFTQVGDWVVVAKGPIQAKSLYWLLSAHLNTTRGDMEVWPTQEMLARALGYSRGDKIKPFIDWLVSIEAVEVRKTRYAGGMRERSIYVINQTPPDDYSGPKSLEDYYRINRGTWKSTVRRGRRKTD